MERVKFLPRLESHKKFGPKPSLINCSQLRVAGTLRAHPTLKRDDVIQMILPRQGCPLLRFNRGACGKCVVLRRQCFPLRSLIATPRRRYGHDSEDDGLNYFDPLPSHSCCGGMMTMLGKFVSEFDVGRSLSHLTRD